MFKNQINEWIKNGGHNNDFNFFIFYYFFNFVVLLKVIHKKISHILVIEHMWRYKIVKILLYFGYGPTTHCKILTF